MAFYDNKQWLLSHIRHSFISSDDTGMCEMVMLGEDISCKLPPITKFDTYPGMEDSEDDEDELDLLGQSLDIQSDIEFGLRRPHPNVVSRSEKMDHNRRRAGKIRHIKWEGSPANLTDEERAGLFQRKDFKKDKQVPSKRYSMLTEQLEKCPTLPQNPFAEYAKYDGNAQVGVPTRIYNIFLTMLEPEKRNYPMEVSILAAAKVQDLIGLVCWKLSLEIGPQNLKDSVQHYGLYIAEDDGEVDWDFPCLEPRETVGKFGFTYLALVERPKKDEDSRSLEREDVHVIISQEPWKPKAHQQDLEDQIRMQGHMTAMEAPLYQSYRVYILSKVRTKTEIHLGVSGEKIEIDPVIQQKVSAKFWNRQKAVSYDMDSIGACDLTDTKSSSRSTFRLVYYNVNVASGDQSDSSHHSDLANYKHHDFEADQKTAFEIVQKINHILELRSSARRKEYLGLRERKSHRKRSFHLGPR